MRWDLSVRAAHLDDTTASSTAPACSCASHGQEDAQCVVDIQRRDGRGVPQLARRDGAAGSARHEALRLRRVSRADYDELIDHPVELGAFALGTLQRARRAARLRDRRARARARHGAPARRPEAHLRSADRVCSSRATKKAPVDRYVFMTQAVERRLRRARASRVDRADLQSRATCRVHGRERASSDGYRTLPRPVQPRVLPHLERQAHQAGGVRAVRLHARELHVAAVALRGLHVATTTT